MSETTPTALSSFSPILHATFEASLKEYEKKTVKDLLTHPLMVQLQGCSSRADTLELLRSQVAQSEQTTSADENLIKWLDPIVKVLSASSSVISEGVGLVNTIQMILQFNMRYHISRCPLPRMSFSLVLASYFRYLSSWILSERSDIGFIQAAKDVIASQDALVVIFRRIDNVFEPLEKYAEVPTTEAVKDIVVKIMVELLEIFAITTKEITQGRASELITDNMFPAVDRGTEMSRKDFFKKFFRCTGIVDALSRLNRLMQEAVEITKAADTEEERR